MLLCHFNDLVRPYSLAGCEAVLSVYSHFSSYVVIVNDDNAQFIERLTLALLTDLSFSKISVWWIPP